MARSQHLWTLLFEPHWPHNERQPRRYPFKPERRQSLFIVVRKSATSRCPIRPLCLTQALVDFSALAALPDRANSFPGGAKKDWSRCLCRVDVFAQ